MTSLSASHPFSPLFCSVLFCSILYRERRIENEVDRVAELQGGKSGNTATGEEGGGVTGSLAVVTVQSIDSVKVA